MKKNLLCAVKAFLTSYGFLAMFHAPLIPTQYETTLDYIIASVYELLGQYDFRIIPVWVVCGFFYAYLNKKEFPGKYSHKLLASLFSGFLLLGNSYYEMGNWDYCFGSTVNFVKTLAAFAGYAFFFHGCMQLLGSFWDGVKVKAASHEALKESRCEKAFWKAFCILLLAYLPVFILSYPGNLCWDAIGQIEQVIFKSGYSNHHPLVHTLFVGGMTQMGYVLFHSYEVGLFIYMLVQLVMFISALAATIWILQKRGVSAAFLTGLTALYVLAPVYSNMASTVLKDVPFISCVIGYMICLCLILESPWYLKNRGFTAAFLALQLGTILFRNNGIYVVCAGGIGAVIYLWKAQDWKKRLHSIAVFFAVSVLFSKLFIALLSQALSAAPGSSGEMLSIPFQQTARYLQFYREELSEEERESIEAILGDVDIVASRYDPKISDPVKALFLKDASGADLLQYFKTWFNCFFKHPFVYIEAFLHHVYGWFSPAMTNAIRYETQYDVIAQEGLFPQASKLVLFFYRFANRFTPLGFLENTGIYVWLLFFVTAYNRRRGYVLQNVMTVPLWISLLICMASPCYIWHPRYAFPIMFTLPFLVLFMKTISKRERGQHAEII